MKTLKIFTIAMILLLGLTPLAKSQNCFLDADYDAEGLTASFTAQMYEFTVNNQDSTVTPVEAQYIWIIGNQSFTGSQFVYQFAAAGNYTVTVTGSSASNCVVTYTLLVFVSDGNPVDSTDYFMVNISGDYYAGENCEAGLTAYVMGGNAPFSYFWSNGVVGSSLTDLCAGEYCVTVADNEGYTASSCFTVYEGNNNEPGDTTWYNNIYLGISYDFASQDDCSAFATVSVSGGTPPYAYQWDNGVTTQVVTGLCIGQTACLTVIDAAGNAATACVYISMDNTNPGDSTLNGDDPWESTLEWEVDSMFNTAEIIDYWVTDTEMCFVWAMVYENSNYTETYTACYPIDAATIEDGYYLVYLHVVFSNGQKANYTFSDVVYAEPSAFLSVGDTPVLPGINLYPNPVSDVLNIEGFDGSASVSICVYNVAGVLLESMDYNRVSGVIALSTGEWPSGVYIVETRTGEVRNTFRIVK